MTNEIVVRQKPNHISWELLAECQQRAHEYNKKCGIYMQCANYTALELKEAVKGGITLVAIDSNGSLMGMLSIIFQRVNRWWHKGEGAYICYVAVNPEYKECGVYKALSIKAEEMIKRHGVVVEYLNTHVKNVIAQRAYKRDGYSKVRFSPGSGTNYYSVEMAKWLDGKGKNKTICQFMYIVSKFIVKLIYKPGKIRRI